MSNAKLTTLRVLADSEMKEGNYTKALQLYQDLVTIDETDPYVWIAMGISKIANLVSNPIKLYEHNQSTINVAFSYFYKSIQNSYSQSHNLNEVTNNEKRILNAVFKCIEILRKKVNEEAGFSQQNLKNAQAHALFAGIQTFSANTGRHHNTFNDTFQANVAYNNASNANHLFQAHQINNKKIEIGNEIITNLKSSISQLISKLIGNHSKEDLNDYQWSLLSWTEREERKKALEKAEREKHYQQRELAIQGVLLTNNEYQNTRKNAIDLFKKEKYASALKAARFSIATYDNTKRKLYPKIAVSNKDWELVNIITEADKKIKDRNITIIMLTIILAAVIYFKIIK